MELTDPNLVVKPPKKERTEAQKKATEKGFAALKARREELKKQQEMAPETSPETAPKRGRPPTKSIPVPQEAPKAVAATPAASSEDMMDTFMKKLLSRMDTVKPESKPEPIQEKKERKKKVVVIEEDSSSSEEEVVIRRKKEKKETTQIKEVAKPVPAEPAFKSTGSHVLDKLLFSKF